MPVISENINDQLFSNGKCDNVLKIVTNIDVTNEELVNSFVDTADNCITECIELDLGNCY